jgi:hypothetical protein
MNERIRQLAEQAGAVFEQTNGLNDCSQDSLVGDEIEKFAELIVRECMACSIWVGKNNTNTVEPIHTAHAINQRIKQHFGVEE